MNGADRRRWRLLVAGAALVLAAVVVLGLVRARPLGHDEATYAVGARALIAGDVADDYPLYRPRAMPALLVPGVAAGGAAWQLRLPFALIAVGHALLTMAIARRLGGGRAAALGFAIQVTAAPWLWRACEALSDIPAAAALLAMTLLAIDDGARARPRWSAWIGFAALGALAIYLRYASAPAVAAIGVATLLAYPARWRALVLAGAGVAAAVAPLLWWSRVETGRITGVLDLSVKMGRRAYPGDGLWYYLTHWPTTVAGPVMGVVALIGLGWGLAAWRRAPAAVAASGPRDVDADDALLAAAADGRRRARRLLALAALGQLLLLGWRVHGEGRYVFFATSALTALGAAWLVARPRRRAIAAWAVALAAIPSAVVTGWQLARLTEQRAGFVRAAEAIRGAAAGERCLILTGNVPQAIWYARCHARLSWGPPDDATVAAFPRVFLLEAAGQVRQPDVAALVRPGLGWRPIACEARPRWCVYLAEAGGAAADRAATP